MSSTLKCEVHDLHATFSFRITLCSKAFAMLQSHDQMHQTLGLHHLFELKEIKKKERSVWTFDLILCLIFDWYLLPDTGWKCPSEALTYLWSLTHTKQIEGFLMVHRVLCARRMPFSPSVAHSAQPYIYTSVTSQKPRACTDCLGKSLSYIQMRADLKSGREHTSC